LKGPGKYSPTEFSNGKTMSVQKINAAFDEGRAIMSTTFVSVEGSQAAPLFTLTARGEKRDALSLFHDAARCAHLVNDHCEFSLEERPYECAMLVPAEDASKCGLPDNQFMEILWVPHQQVLRELIEMRTGRSWRKELVEQVLSRKTDDSYSKGAYDFLTSIGLVKDDEEADETIAEWQRSLQRPQSGGLPRSENARIT